MTLIIIQLFRSLGRNFYYFTLFNGFLFSGLINRRDIKWEYVLSSLYPKFYTYVKKIEDNTKDNTWWMKKLLDLTELVIGTLDLEALVDNPTVLQRIDISAN